MPFLMREKHRVGNILSLLIPFCLTTPAVAQDGDRSVQETTRAVQAGGQAIITQKTAHMQQRLITEIVQNYETELAQQVTNQMDQLALAVDIDIVPVILPGPGELLANVVVEADDGCAY